MRIVSQTDAIGIAVEEALSEPMARGELVRLHFRNLPNNVDILQARCGIVTRSGDRLSAAARAMIELLVDLDAGVESAVA